MSVPSWEGVFAPSSRKRKFGKYLPNSCNLLLLFYFFLFVHNLFSSKIWMSKFLEFLRQQEVEGLEFLRQHAVKILRITTYAVKVLKITTSNYLMTLLVLKLNSMVFRCSISLNDADGMINSAEHALISFYGEIHQVHRMRSVMCAWSSFYGEINFIV